MLRVLQDSREIAVARSDLVRRRASALDGPVTRMLRRYGVVPGVAVGDPLKSWDVQKTVDFLKKNYGPRARALDIGCFACEILPILHRLGFADLTGVDLNPQVQQMPLNRAVRYVVGNFLDTGFPDRSFDCVTAVSVIEHGFQPGPLLAEMSRLLRPGGTFVASFDYWPEKIDTRGQLIFGLSWDIFSARETAAFVEQAHTFGFEPYSTLEFSASAAPIHYAGHQYTFAWLVLRKS
jgi:SAM-dependent methyltransferase